MTKDSVWLIDLSAIFWSAWHAGAGKEPDYPHSVTVWAVRKLAERSPYVAVCCDSKRNARREEVASYKANRPDKDPVAVDQLGRCIRTLRQDGLPIWGSDGFEADDIIDAATNWATVEADHSVVIATADKDLYQLIGVYGDGRTVQVWNTKHETWIGPAEVQEKFGVRPDQVGDLLAIMGDSSDNIAGVPGVGPKTAAKWLAAYDDLAGIQSAAAEDGEVIKGKARESLLTARDAIETALALVRLRGEKVTGIDFAAVLRSRNVKPLEEINDMSTEEQAKEEKKKADNPAAPDSQPGQTEAANDALAKVDFGAPSNIVKPAGDEWALALEPGDARQAYRMAMALYNARLFKLPNADAVFGAILLGRTLGVGAMQVLRNVHYFDGKLTLSAQFMVGLVMQSGKAGFFKCVESSSERAVWKTHRVDDPDPEPTVETFTIEDAKAAGLVGKDNWKKYPKNMLSARASANLARMVYPDVVAGLYTPDEINPDATIEVEAA